MGCSACKSTPAETKTAAQRREVWNSIAMRLPRAKTDEDKEKRIDLFKQFDTNNNNELTITECNTGAANVLHLQDFTDNYKTVVKRAFDKARSAGGALNNGDSSNTVQFGEFRLFLCYIYDYLEVMLMFDEIDDSGNGLVTSKEFEKAVPKLREWGVQISDADATFKKIDADGSGQMTFDEFAGWAVDMRLDADGDFKNTANINAAPATTNASRDIDLNKMGLPANAGTTTKTKEDRKKAWNTLASRLPTKKTAEDKAARITLFKEFDKDGSKSLTLRETYDGCINILHLDDFTNRLPDIVARAFNKAKGLGGKVEGKGEDNLVEFLEFRIMLIYIHNYFQLTVAFDEIDTSGTGTLSRSEFIAAAPKFAEWGYPLSNPSAVFDQLDGNKSGKVTFDEFAAYAVESNISDPDK